MRRESFLNKRIPSLLGIAILIGGILLTGWMGRTGLIFTGRAAPGNTPQNVRVTNITDSSFTVTYLTGDTVLGTVSYTGGDGNESVAFDIRDTKSGRSSPQTTHAITIANLTPATTYNYKINSGGGTFTNNGQAFTIRTGRKIAGATPSNKQVKGKVIRPDGIPASQALVYLKSGSSQILSSITNVEGIYTIPTAALRTKDLSSYITLQPTTKLSLTAQSTDGTTTVTVFAKGTNPVPAITLTNKYNFAAIEGKTKIASESASVTGFPQSDIGPGSGAVGVSIIFPQDGQVLSDQRPTFKGTAAPATEIEITLDSDQPIQANVMSDRKGNWTYRPKTGVAPGQVNVTVNARDTSGVIESVTQSFTVLAPGSQFTDPSVSPVKTSPTPTTKPISPTPSGEESTPTPTIPLATPTTISNTPTIAPTVPSTVISIQPTGSTPVPTLQPTGTNDAILYALVGSVAIIIGAALLFLTGGMSL